ncbi:MAG: helix-turn-helix domain-containing protein [Methanomethylovorans sp.]|uniref:AlbA family DNA-binding domain-containing protein n=1 Tax=Methanomethylovorans sp. TaxID=2758717 RepID=UPI003530D3A0
MLFKKNFNDIDFSDIQKLMADQIGESGILEYKEQLIDPKSFLKEVAAFSNTSGGFLIFGVKESDQDGYPFSIIGISDKTCNVEQLEHLINGNVQPRINVQIKKIPTNEPEKIVLLIRIPEGQNRPYYNNVSGKFHKRYNFEAKEMDEHEIEGLYLERFFGAGKLSSYIDETISFNRSILSENSQYLMDTHIIITPLRVNEILIDPSNIKKFDFKVNDVRFEPDKTSPYLYGQSVPSKYGIRWISNYRDSCVEIHRNGLIYYREQFGKIAVADNKKIMDDYHLSIRLLQTIRFANKVYTELDFAGRVKIILKVYDSKNSIVYIPPQFHEDDKVCLSENIFVEREWDSWNLDEDCSKIGKSMLDELSSHYGLWRSRYLVEENGEIMFKKSLF